MSQCDQIGLFPNGLGDKFFTKVAQIYVDFWFFSKHHFVSKNCCCDNFLGHILWKFGYFLVVHLVALKRALVCVERSLH